MQRTKSKILSILLSLVMLLSLLPTTALAAGNYPAANAVSVDGGIDFSSSLYYKNTDTAGNFTGTSTDYNAAYDPSTGTLTLSGYDGGRITLGGASDRDLTIKLIGNNTVTVGSDAGIVATSTGCNIIITADNGSSGKLTINATSGSGDAYGIGTGLASGAVSGNVTITGYADVTINATTSGSNDYSFGIYAAGKVAIEGHAKVAISAKAPSITVDDQVYGIYAKTNVTIDTAGEITVDASNADNEANVYSTGVNSMGTLTLTKAGRMTVKWKGNSGVPFYPRESFSDTDHAINVDKTNCYASYRFGTPHTVEVVNGTLAGTGVVSHANNNGNFLAGDKVEIKPSEMKGKSGEVIPFKEWTPSDVAFTSPATTENNSFTVPAKKVTVIAEHSPFDGKPTFTPTGDLNDRGLLTFNTVVNPYDGNEYFALVKVGEEGSYNAIRPDTSSQTKPYVYTYEATSRHSSSYVAPGEYYVAEYLDGWWYLSEKFTVNYVKPHPEISVSYWPDPTDFGSVNVGYTYTTGRNLTIDNKGEAATGELTITVEGKNPDAFTVSKKVINNIPAGGSATSTVRPAMGLPADTYTATLKISGDNVNTLNINVKFTVKDPNASATVSGTALSWNATDDALYYLYPSTTEDAAIRAQWKTGGTVSGYTHTGTKNAITATTVDGKAMQAQPFSFGTIPAGSYKLVIFKPGKYVPKIVPITVGTTDYDCGQLKLWLYGDVNYDGQVLANDATQIIRKGNGVGSIFDTGDALTKIDRVTAADLNEDGVIKTNDAAQITRFANGLGSTFNNFK